MAALKPCNLYDYCVVNGLSLFDVTLPCIFCKHDLSFVALADFHAKTLQLLHKDDGCYACCAECLRLSAKFEIENHFQCCVDARFFTTICEKPLHEITVRCLECYRLLDYIEKFDCCAADSPFCLVRGRWRNLCRHCIKKI
uniref:Protein E6 n=1 Tax=Human papillomavirus TaxID=10566 RepID=A0A385PMI3_9PAPI|nr:MAG: E6 protein [Human papillomavirus]